MVPEEVEQVDVSTEIIGISPQPAIRDRLTVVDKVYHQPMSGGEAFCCETTFDRWLDSDESVYSRKIKVGSEWKRLHFGWFTDESKPVGMLVIRNDEGKHLQANLSQEEKTNLAKKMLEIGILPDTSQIGVLTARLLQVTSINPDVSGSLAEAVRTILRETITQSMTAFLVPPGESMRGVPSEVDLHVRCLHGDCSFTVFAFPK